MPSPVRPLSNQNRTASLSKKRLRPSSAKMGIERICSSVTSSP